MSVSDAQLKANKKYHAKFERIYIRVPVGEKELVEAHAEKMQESVNAFVQRAIAEAIARDNETQESNE